MEISKARLGNYITNLTVDEMKQVDKAIALSLDLHHYYKTLQNTYNDKLQYIEKLKNVREKLQKDCADQKKQINSFQNLLVQYHFPDIQSLANFLEKHSKDQ